MHGALRHIPRANLKMEGGFGFVLVAVASARLHTIYPPNPPYENHRKDDSAVKRWQQRNYTSLMCCELMGSP